MLILRIRAAIAAVCVAACTAWAQSPGQPDPTFGVDGVQLLDFGAPANVTIVASARQSSGKIIVAGNAITPQGTRRPTVGRLNADGTEDLDFGTNGWTTLGDNSAESFVIAVAVFPDDRIVFVGRDNNFQTIIGVLGANGSRGSLYGPTGYATDYNGFAETPRAVAVHNGQIIVAGGYNDFQSKDTYLVQYDAAAFRMSAVRYAFGAGNDEARAILVHFGNVFLAGYSENASGNRDFLLAKLRSDYTLDTNFGAGAGWRAYDNNGRQDDAFALTLRNNGHILLGGRSSATPDTAQWAVASVQEFSGDIDTNIGTNGWILIDTPWAGGASYSTIAALEVPNFFSPDFVAVGSVRPSPNPGPHQSRMALARFSLDGQPYPGFGVNGVEQIVGEANWGDIAVGGYINPSLDKIITIGARYRGGEYVLTGRFELAYGIPDTNFAAPWGWRETLAYMTSIDQMKALAAMPGGGYAGIAVAGMQTYLFRTNSDGSFLPTFGWQGAQLLENGEPGGKIAVQPDARIIVARLVDVTPGGAYQLSVTRRELNGVLDYTFNGTGSALIDFGTPVFFVDAVAVQPDGKILVMVSYPANTPMGQLFRIGLARLNSDGTPDWMFGSSGKVTLERNQGAEQGRGMALQPDGTIMVAGTDYGPSFAMLVYRVSPWGSIDFSWPNGGAAPANCNAPNQGGVAVTANGGVVVGGQWGSSACFTRLGPNGMPDPSFGSGGTALHYLGAGVASGVAVQADGKIVASLAQTGNAHVARLDTNGALDFTFAGSGYATVSGHQSGVDGIVLQADNKPVVWASTVMLQEYDALIARFIGGPGGGGGGDTTPDPFAFTDYPDAPLSTQVTSNPIFITGIDSPAPVSVAGGEYSIGCGEPYTSAPGMAVNGDAICVRHVTASIQETPTDTTLTVGGVSDTFTSTTARDTEPPDTFLDSGPSGTVASTSATFEFHASEVGAILVCRLDGGQYSGCSSPKTYTGLSQGSHTFEVAAFDGNGNIDPTPATATWTVDTVAPDTSIASAPPAWTSSSNATFTFTAEAGATFQCKLDGAPDFTACTSPASYSGLAEGVHVFQVRAADAAGNLESEPAAHQWTIDLSAPDTLILSGPPANTSATSATITFQSSEPGATFQCRLDGAAFAGCTSPAAYSGLAPGAHVFEVRAVDAAGNTDASPATVAWNIDTVLPDTTILSAPSAWTSATVATFTFGAEPGSTFECGLDGAAFASCTSPASYTGLAEGAHTFQVRATDAAGNVEAEPAQHQWNVDLTTPETLITSGPAPLTTLDDAVFTFQSNDAGATFECSLDGSAFAACASPVAYADFADGTHVFSVRARDAAGNVDASPSQFSWVVDTTPPNTTMVVNPGMPITNQTSFTATFVIILDGSTFECSLDGAAFTPCTSPYTGTGLADGEHTFQGRAIDPAGNVDPTPASHTWLVDSTPPDTTIVTAPPALTASTSATISYTSNETVLSFQCRVDGGEWVPCVGTSFLSGLADGVHTFEVRARDFAGNIDPTPASHTWTVDTTAPETSIDGGPTGSVASTAATFTFSSNEGAVTFQCRVDGGALFPCTSPHSLSGLAQGAHTFDVRATDAVGFTDSSPAARTWTVDTIAPDTTITGGPTGNNNPLTVTFTFASTEGGSTFECSLDGSAFAACLSGQSITVVKGEHTFRVRAIDSAGNVDATPASRTWRSH